jgi:hypothetical protein
MPRRHLVPWTFVCLLVVAPAAFATARAIDLGRSRIAVRRGIARLTVQGTCALHDVAVGQPVSLGVAGMNVTAAAGVAAQRRRSVLVDDDGVPRGRLRLRAIPGHGVRFRARLSAPAPSGPLNPVDVSFRLGDEGCTRTVIFASRVVRDTTKLRYPAKGGPDADGDGARRGDGDCHDGDPGIGPDAVDVCGNGLDEDCTGSDVPCHPPLYPGLRVGDANAGSAAGDLNGDGVLDLVYGTFGSDVGHPVDEVSVLLGRGDGTFVKAAPLTTGVGPSAVAVGDFDADGRDDVVAASGVTGELQVFLATSDGTFVPSTPVTVAPAPLDVAVGRLDANTTLDVVSVQYANGEPGAGTVAVLLGNGDGTFAPPLTVATIDAPAALALADLDADGNTDVAIADHRAQVAVHLGGGDGGLGAPLPLPPTPGNSGGGTALVAARLDADATIDLVVAEPFDEASVFLGNGDGTFAFAGGHPVGGGAVGVGDVDGDGLADVVGPAGVAFGVGGGAFAAPLSVGPGFAGHVLVADLDRDERLDLIVGPWLYLGRGERAFGTRAAPTAFFPQALAVGALDADGIPDLAVAGELEIDSDTGLEVGFLATFLGGADGTPVFRAELPLVTSQTTAIPGVAIGDLDDAGASDVGVAVRPGPGLRLLAGNGDGTLSPLDELPAPPLGFTDLIAADLDADGHGDVVAASGTAREVHVFLGSPGGGFVAPQIHAAGTDVVPFAFQGARLALGFLDGDAILDLAVTSDESDEVAVLRGLGGGDFAPQQRFATGDGPSDVVIADLDGDGDADLAVANGDSRDVSLLLGDGAGGFAPEVRVSTAGPGEPNGSAQPVLVEIAAADVDADGRIDLAVTTLAANDVRLLRNQGGTTFSLEVYGVGSVTRALALADFDASGTPDLAVSHDGGVRILLHR